MLPSVWPFARWGIDIVGPLPTAPGNYKYAVVAIEYFSKWIEAKAVQNVTSQVIQKFFWQNVVCRFGVPYEITVDNGKQFDSTDFRKFCFHLGTKLCFASVYHPQSNGAVEKANAIIFTGIKRNLTGMPRGKWAEELPRVVWSQNTTESRTTKFTPFRLLYGEEAMVPEEIKWGSIRTEEEPESSDMQVAIDAREETKLQALHNISSYQDETRRWKNKKIMRRNIATGDMVLCKKTKGVGKLQEKWDGPFLATKTNPGDFRLQTLGAKTWTTRGTRTCCKNIGSRRSSSTSSFIPFFPSFFFPYTFL